MSDNVQNVDFTASPLRIKRIILNENKVIRIKDIEKTNVPKPEQVPPLILKGMELGFSREEAESLADMGCSFDGSMVDTVIFNKVNIQRLSAAVMEIEDILLQE